MEQQRAAIPRREELGRARRSQLAREPLVEEQRALRRPPRRIVAQQQRVLVAQREQAGRFEPDDRRAALDVRSERRDIGARVLAGAVQQPLGDRRAAAAGGVLDQRDAVAERLDDPRRRKAHLRVGVVGESVDEQRDLIALFARSGWGRALAEAAPECPIGEAGQRALAVQAGAVQQAARRRQAGQRVGQTRRGGAQPREPRDLGEGAVAQRARP